jgi:hypothetical protein
MTIANRVRDLFRLAALARRVNRAQRRELVRLAHLRRCVDAARMVS